MTTAVIGKGWVGKSMLELFPRSIVHDPAIGKDFKDEVNNCDVAFVCVPTPNTPSGDLDTSIVEETVEWCEADLIVIRSTVNPGTVDKLKRRFDKRIVIQPEYLGELLAHPMLDPNTRPFIVVGGAPTDRRMLIELYTTVYNANISIRQVTALEAEVIKLTENRAIAFKVAQCQELYDVCEAAGVDYYTVRDAVYGDDPRFDLWFTFIYPDKRGMNSKCIPKDVIAWAAWAESVGIEPDITTAILRKNMEWLNA